MKSTIEVKGHISIKVFDKDGNLKSRLDKQNTIVTVGKTYLATWLAAASQAGKFMSYVGLGSGTTAANASDTTLESAVGSRALGTLSSASNVWQNVATFGPGEATGTITEAGLFTASTAGTMFARQVFSAQPKQADDTLELTWTVTFS